MIMVTCTTCGKSKSESEYPTHNGRRHGKKCKACKRGYNADWYQQNRETILDRHRVEQLPIKLEAMTRYGGTCSVCGEAAIEFLCLDHVDDNGQIHRELLGPGANGGFMFYRALRDLGWPTAPRLQVLCHNHNAVKHQTLLLSGNGASKRRRRVKAEAMAAYGSSCFCCNESDLAALSLDHIGGGGRTHVLEFTDGVKSRFYTRLRSAGWPNDPPLRVACMNCNLGREQNDGVCPHERLVS